MTGRVARQGRFAAGSRYTPTGASKPQQLNQVSKGGKARGTNWRMEAHRAALHSEQHCGWIVMGQRLASDSRASPTSEMNVSSLRTLESLGSIKPRPRRGRLPRPHKSISRWPFFFSAARVRDPDRQAKPCHPAEDVPTSYVLPHMAVRKMYKKESQENHDRQAPAYQIRFTVMGSCCRRTDRKGPHNGSVAMTCKPLPAVLTPGLLCYD